MEISDSNVERLTSSRRLANGPEHLVAVSEQRLQPFPDHRPKALDLGNANRYLYVGGDSINGVDPSGLQGRCANASPSACKRDRALAAADAKKRSTEPGYTACTIEEGAGGGVAGFGVGALTGPAAPVAAPVLSIVGGAYGSIRGLYNCG